MYQILDYVLNIVSDDVSDIICTRFQMTGTGIVCARGIHRKLERGGEAQVDREENARSADQSGSNVSHVLQLPWYHTMLQLLASQFNF